MSDFYQESVVISTILSSPHRLRECNLSPSEFGNETLAEVYSAMVDLDNRGESVDIFTVGQFLDQKTGRPWFDTLVEITKGGHSTSDLSKYSDYVRTASEWRKAREIGATLANSQISSSVVDDAIRDLMALTVKKTRHQFTMNSAMKLALADLEEAHQGKRTGVSTGLADLDAKLGGLHAGDLIIIGARPAMGKTAMMLNVALAASESVGVGIFSGEQDISQIVQRMIAIKGRVPVMRMRNGDMIDEDWGKITASVTSMKDRNIVFDDTPSPSLAHVFRNARQWAYQSNIGVLMIDYLQRMECDKRVKRFEGVGENVRGLKNLARELGIPVVVLAQVGRDVDKRNDKRPGMGDLSDSSEIEKEADQIFLLYRDEVYNEDTMDKGVVEILIDKNRHGPTGYVKAIWRGECMRFDNMARNVQ